MENTINNDETSGYIPGVCNIGREEINARKKTMYFSLVLLVVTIIVLELVHANHWWGISVFILATSFAVSFQQVYFKFCVNFGMRGVFNFGDMDKTFTVEQKEYYKKDRAKAMKMIIVGILFGAIVSLIFYFV